NTAVARRLAFGGRVVLVGKNGYQPRGPGPVTPITGHQVEGLWEEETARGHRRPQLYKFRKTRLVSEPHGEWDPRCSCGETERDAGGEAEGRGRSTERHAR